MDSDVLSPHLKQVYLLVAEKGPITGAVAFELSVKRNVDARLRELMHYGVVKKVGLRHCRVSGRKAAQYAITGEPPHEPAPEKFYVPTPKECKEAAEYFDRLYLIGSAHGARPASSATHRVAAWLRQGAPTNSKEK